MTGYEMAQANLSKMIGEFVDAGIERFGGVDEFAAALAAYNAQRKVA
jgi:hypothetical protein